MNLFFRRRMVGGVSDGIAGPWRSLPPPLQQYQRGGGRDDALWRQLSRDISTKVNYAQNIGIMCRLDVKMIPTNDWSA